MRMDYFAGRLLRQDNLDGERRREKRAIARRIVEEMRADEVEYERVGCT